MISEQDISRVIGSNAVDADGHELGSVTEVYLDDQSGRPEWATVKTGLFGTKSTFVPLAEATVEGGHLRVPYQKAEVEDAPRIEAEGHLSPSEEAELYRWYGRGDGDPATTGTDTTTATSGDARGAVGHDTSGPTTDSAMTRSEEQLHVGTQQVETGRARLRKHVVTENVSTTVPVSHDEVRVVREPITDADVGDALSGPTLSEEEHEVVLDAERPVVQKETVPVERVRLATETVTGQETVSDQVHKEQIEVDGDGVTDADRR